jgi:hypothetical protein
MGSPLPCIPSRTRRENECDFVVAQIVPEKSFSCKTVCLDSFE